MLWLLAAVVVVALAAIAIYNSLVGLRVQSDNAWADIDVQLKRRYDLVPNLVGKVALEGERPPKVSVAVALRNASPPSCERIVYIALAHRRSARRPAEVISRIRLVTSGA